MLIRELEVNVAAERGRHQCRFFERLATSTERDDLRIGCGERERNRTTQMGAAPTDADSKPGQRIVCEDGLRSLIPPPASSA
jgi:hypothetical protein